MACAPYSPYILHTISPNTQDCILYFLCNSFHPVFLIYPSYLPHEHYLTSLRCALFVVNRSISPYVLCFLFTSCTFFTGRNEVVAKVIFLHLSVIHSVHRAPQNRHPPRSRHTPPGADTSPPSRPPHTPLGLSTPPREADSGIRPTSGGYASYWNAFLFLNAQASAT